METAQGFCSGCGNILTDINWAPSLRGRFWKCRVCYQHKVPKLHCQRCGSGLQGTKCFSCTLLEEPPRCGVCSVLLTEKNWTPSLKRMRSMKCRTCYKAMTKKWEEKNPDKNGAARSKAWNDRNPDHRPTYYRANKAAYAERARQRLWQAKIAVLNRLGGACVVCGITDMRVLQINHLNGGGSKEGVHGMDMYMAILAGTRATDDLDVRCANHNLLYEYEVGRRALPQGLDFSARAVDDTASALTDLKESPYGRSD
jgi:hypothetical protein